MSHVITLLRLCLVVMFGSMSLMHGPVMTFSGSHMAIATHPHAGSAAAVEPDCHADEVPSAKHAMCNAFGCLIAVEPLPITTRALIPVLFAVMAAAPMTALDPLPTAPALPPPRFQS